MSKSQKKDKQCLIILPNSLFDIKLLESKITNLHSLDIFIIEEPYFFGMREPITLNFNTLKLAYHRATMRLYFDELQEKLPKNDITYLDYSQLSSPTKYKPFFNKYNSILIFDPVDTYLEAKYSKILKNITYLDTPLFLCTKDDLESYHSTKKNKDSYFHASFYTWQRNRLDILAGSKTYDTENRNMMPLETKVPKLITPYSPLQKKYINEAFHYVSRIWPNNYTPIDTASKTEIKFPISREYALIWLNDFCKNKFKLFGKYEDSIDSVPRNVLFHSAITPMLNIGLITPDEVIDVITKYYNSHKTQIGIANYEAFIRQIIGWREYQRYIYLYAGEKMRASNYFSNSKKLGPHWYNATTGIDPVDDAIKMAWNDGYIHHILRLMVVGNFMNLCGIHPDDVYKWFMEFSLDSYDWVMVGNVYSMALWADGGITMRKPYISGSGYILKMSNYLPANDKTNWIENWNTVFHHFIDRCQNGLKPTYYKGLVNAWNRKSLEERKKELKIANEIINKITK